MINAQQSRMEALFETMRDHSDRKATHRAGGWSRPLAAGRTLTPVNLTAVTAAIGATHAALRQPLEVSFATVEVLTSEQVRRYKELCGYPQGY